MRRGVLAFLLAIGLIAMQTGAYAAIDVQSGEMVNLSVSYGNEYTGNEVSVEVLQPGKTLSDSEAVPKQWLAWISQHTLEDNGVLNLSFVPNSGAGYYNVRIKLCGHAKTETVQIAFKPESAVNGLIEELNELDASNESSLEFVKKLFSETAESGRFNGYELLSFDELAEYNMFSKMSESVKENFYATFLNGIGDGETLESMKALFKYAVCVESFLAMNADEGVKFLEEKAHELGIDSAECFVSLYANESMATDESRKITVNRLLKYDWTVKNQDSFLEVFNEQAFLGTVESLTTAGGLENVVKAAEAYLEGKDIDVSGYMALNKKASVNQKAADSFDSLNNFKEIFNTAVKNADNASGTSTQKGSGGGSGGGVSARVDTTLVAPAEIPYLTSDYSDIDTVSWASEAIEGLSNKGIISGKEPGVFYPMDEMKREEFIKILILGFDLSDDSAAASFSDVAESDWFYPYVAAAYAKNITSGYGGIFGVGDKITRQDAVTLLYRAACMNGREFSETAVQSFSDGDEISDYAKEAVALMSAGGIISGRDDGRFDPKGFITRAEAAKLLYLLIS